MTPLRQTMIQAMCQHGFTPRTQHSYLHVVTALARYYRRSPDQLSVDELQVFLTTWFRNAPCPRPVVVSICTASGFCICRCCTGRTSMCPWCCQSVLSVFQSC